MTKQKIVEVEITGLAHKGAAAGRTDDGMVVFVQGVVPGDRVKVLLHKKRKGSWQGFAEEIIRYSKHRVTPVCRHFGVCGGCSWQHLNYGEQLRQKEILVRDALTRIGKLDASVIDDILPAQQTEYYRNKLEYTFSNNRWLSKEELVNKDLTLERAALGFHRPGIFYKVVDITKCHLQRDNTNPIRNFIRDYALKEHFDFYDIKDKKGFLRNLIIKSNEQGNIMCIFILSHLDEAFISSIIKHLVSRFPEIISIYYSVNAKSNDSYSDLNFIKCFGEDYLVETLDQVKYYIGPKTFFQTNTRQATALFKLVADYSGLTGKEIVYDWYCGVGSIGIFLANRAAQVIGIEEVPESIEDAKLNAALNGLKNCHFITSDTKHIVVEEWLQKYKAPDLIIVDPPRMGLHPEVISKLTMFKPPRIIYVSCNPSTLARDLLLLQTHYKVEKIKPVDMFPHTNHVESVALLSLQ